MNKKEPSFIRFFTSLDTVTKTLLSLNIIAYILIVSNYGLDAIRGLNVEQLLNIGGVSGGSPFITILLSMFLHYSFLHIIVNMGVLVLLSRTINDNFSQMAYLFVFLISGIIGNFIAQDYTPNIVSVGASGGIYGLIGLLLVSALFKKKYPDLYSIFFLIFITAVVFVIGTFFSPMANLTTHIIGIIVGCGSAFLLQNFKMEVIREDGIDGK